jgi:Tfp pilus assembly pilus retraction ATPase PilT
MTPEKPLVSPDSVFYMDDYTFYLAPSMCGELVGKDDVFPKAYNGELHIARSKDDEKGSIAGRALACPCYRGRHVSVTLRSTKDHQVPSDGEPRKASWTDYTALEPALLETESGYRPKHQERFPVQTAAISEELDKRIFREGQPEQGLIVITGMTASAKSEVARGLIDILLLRRVKKLAEKWKDLASEWEKTDDADDNRHQPGRRPHLLTFEDPIETRYTESPQKARELGVDYTPREKGTDVMSLEDAVDDALRQTPAVFYVGEVRRAEDWRTLLEFAGTGHLVVTTAHAGSLVEAIERILAAVRAVTPADRGHYAQRLLAVVHQRLVRATGSPPALLPSVWTGNSPGIAALIEDGLASILPHYPTTEQQLAHVSSIGRRWFADKLLKASSDGNPVTKEQKEALVKKAAEHDLQGY